MKRLLARMKRAPASPADDAGPLSSMLPEPAHAPLVAWRERAPQVGATPFDRRAGAGLFARLWGADRHVVALAPDELQRMGEYLDFVQVPQGREVIAQDELGDYMLVVLEGTLSMDRGPPARGSRTRLAEAHAGDMLGDMSLLDAGARFCSCQTLRPCTLAVIESRRLEEMIAREPRLAVALLASLSRRLSLRLRQVSARLSALLSQN